MDPVQGTPVASVELLYDSDKAGAFFITEGGVFIWVHCPCGCGGYFRLPIYTDTKTEEPSWEWNGNREKPTLKPSIRDLLTCKFHGHLTNGVWTFEADSGVK